MSQRIENFVGITFRMKTWGSEGKEAEIGRGSSQHAMQSPWKLQLPISQGALRPDCSDYLQFSAVGTMVLTISRPWTAHCFICITLGTAMTLCKNASFLTQGIPEGNHSYIWSSSSSVNIWKNKSSSQILEAKWQITAPLQR